MARTRYKQIVENTCANCGMLPQDGVVFAYNWDEVRAGSAVCENCNTVVPPKKPVIAEPRDARLDLELNPIMCNGLGPSRLKTLNKAGIITIGDMLQDVHVIARRASFSPILIEQYQDDLRAFLAETEESEEEE